MKMIAICQNHKTLLKGFFLVSLCILCAVVYLPGLSGPFVFDDNHNIVNNPHISINSLSPEQLKDAAVNSPTSERPVSNLSFALNFYFNGRDTTGYHVVNLGIHIVNGMLLFLLLHLTFNISFGGTQVNSMEKAGKPLPGDGLTDKNWFISFFCSAFFLLHPAMTQAVTYVVQRMSLLAAFFSLSAMIFYVLGRKAALKASSCVFFFMAVLSFSLAMGSKEIAVVLPFLILLYEWFFFQHASRKWLSKGIVLFLFTLLFLGVFIYFYTGKDPVSFILNSYRNRPFTLSQRLMTELRVVVFGLGLILFPHPARLNLDHQIPLSTSFLNPITTTFSAVSLVLLFVLAFYTAKKSPLFSFGILWFLISLLPESSFLGIELFFEHRLYFPGLFMIPGIVFLVFQVIPENKKAIAGIVLILLVFSAWSWQRNQIWRDAVTLFEDSAEKSPQKFRPVYNLGVAHMENNQLAKAREAFSKAVSTSPGEVRGLNNLGLVLAFMEEYGDAAIYYRKALKIQPDHGQTHFNLAQALRNMGKIDEAITHYEKAIDIMPDTVQTYINLSILLAAKNKPDKALGLLEDAGKIAPDNPDIWINTGNILTSQGELEKGKNAYLKALGLSKDNRDAQYNLAINRIKADRIDEAFTLFTLAKGLKTEDPETFHRFGALLHDLDKPEDAIRAYLYVLERKPDDAKLHYNLALSLVKLGRIEKALTHLQKAVALDPEFADAHFNLANLLAFQGKDKKAVQHYIQATNLDPNHRKAQINLRKVLNRMSMRKKENTKNPGYP